MARGSGTEGRSRQVTSPRAEARPGPRQATWSRRLTAPLAARIPPRYHGATLGAIKAVHTVVFLSVASLIVVYAWDGARRRAGRRTRLALTVALAEAAVFASNNQVCPLTPLAEELGAENGSVTDILLPLWLSRRIPLLSGSMLCIGILLNLRNWREHQGLAHRA